MPALPFFERLVYVSDFFVAIGAGILIQSTVIILAGLCLASFLRKRGAAVESVILRLFLVAVFLCPVVSVLLDVNTVPMFEFRLPRALPDRTPTVLSHTPSQPNESGFDTGFMADESVGVPGIPGKQGMPVNGITGSPIHPGYGERSPGAPDIAEEPRGKFRYSHCLYRRHDPLDFLHAVLHRQVDRLLNPYYVHPHDR